MRVRILSRGCTKRKNDYCYGSEFIGNSAHFVTQRAIHCVILSEMARNCEYSRTEYANLFFFSLNRMHHGAVTVSCERRTEEKINILVKTTELFWFWPCKKRNPPPPPISRDLKSRSQYGGPFLDNLCRYISLLLERRFSGSARTVESNQSE